MDAKRLPALLALASLAVAGAAWAVKPGGTLYIKAKNTQLKASAAPTANTLAVLQPGEAVTYGGREGKGPWCRVTTARKVSGVVYQANLSTTPPSLEVSSTSPGKRLDPQAFASSGAAVKALGPGVMDYGRTLEHRESAEQLHALEQLAAGIPDAEVSAYAKAAGLPEVVGPGAAATREQGP